MTSSIPAELSFHPGDTVAGKYRIDRLLGAGGMGKVYAAHDTLLDRSVALKFLLLERGSEADRARFLREARALARLSNEHVPRTFEVGELPSGEPFLALELLKGRDLAAELEGRGGAVPVEQAVDWVLEACLGLAEAHALGMVHRDLKPANLFLAERKDGTRGVKLLDFGITKSASGVDPTLTGAASMMGSPAYMSPEQFRSARDVDQRTDVWSLGVILYELVAGHGPFAGETVIALYHAVSEGQPPPLQSPLGELPQGFESAVLRCLIKDRSQRYRSLGALAEALTPYAQHQKGALGKIRRTLGESTDPTSLTPTQAVGPSIGPPSNPGAGHPIATPGTVTGASLATGMPSAFLADSAASRFRWVAATLGAAAVLGMLGLVIASWSSASHPTVGAAPAMPSASSVHDPNTRLTLPSSSVGGTAASDAGSAPLGSASSEALPSDTSRDARLQVPSARAPSLEPRLRTLPRDATAPSSSAQVATLPSADSPEATAAATGSGSVYLRRK